MAQLTGTSSSPGTPAVSGKHKNSGVGVYGSSETFEGVHGDSNSPNTAAVAGENNTAKDSIGTYGRSDPGRGVVGVSAIGTGVYGSSDAFEGVHGESNSPNTAAVAGENNTAKDSIGTYGRSDPGRGVVGVSAIGTGVYGSSDAFEGVHGESNSPNTAAVAGENNTAPGSVGTWGRSDPGRGVVGVSASGTGVYGSSQTFEGVHGESNSPNTAAIAGINNNSGMGIYGKSARGDAGFFDGNVTITGDISLTGADCAEEFDLAEASAIEPGTVMVVGKGGTLCASGVPYDKKVAGVVSGAGNYEPGIVLDRQHRATGRAAIALVGKVYCKVDASHGSIEAGDLLTTSPTAGHAMSVSDQTQALGAVIGKALQPWTQGKGLIPILVTLQ